MISAICFLFSLIIVLFEMPEYNHFELLKKEQGISFIKM